MKKIKRYDVGEYDYYEHQEGGWCDSEDVTALESRIEELEGLLKDWNDFFGGDESENCNCHICKTTRYIKTITEE